MYTKVSEDDIDEIWESHVKNGKIVERLLSPHEEEFFSKQNRIALKNCGRINPERIEEYIALDGYAALAKALYEMEPEDVIEIIKASGLRGRGGGGFPAGTKWEVAAQQQTEEKIVVCNADEGDPGAFMDRSILEDDQHAVLEAMAITAYAIGAQSGYIYVRAEYPTAVERLKIAIAQARAYGLLGENILGKGLNFDILPNAINNPRGREKSSVQKKISTETSIPPASCETSAIISIFIPPNFFRQTKKDPPDLFVVCLATHFSADLLIGNK